MRLMNKNKKFKFLQVSTDEVFGSIEQGKFNEESPYNPNSPYAASKAGADHLISAYFKTFNFPGIITNCSNNYGPNQFPEKLVPLIIIKALQDKMIPIYGQGQQMRDWLHVDDHCSALLSILDKGKNGSRYLIGGDNCIKNIDMAISICKILDQMKPLQNKKYENLINFVQDRPGHDQRYAVNSNKIKSDLNWEPKINFNLGLKDTIKWYIDNDNWWKKILKENYSGNRIGLKLKS